MEKKYERLQVVDSKICAQWYTLNNNSNKDHCCWVGEGEVRSGAAGMNMNRRGVENAPWAGVKIFVIVYLPTQQAAKQSSSKYKLRSDLFFFLPKECDKRIDSLHGRKNGD